MSFGKPFESFDVESYVRRLTQGARSSKSVTHVHRMASKPAVYGEYGALISASMERALRRRGIERPYIHQEAAWKHLRAGDDLVVVTPTASGKTLCYYAPLISMLEEDPDGSALLFYPTKALAQDQCAELNDLLGLAELSAVAHVYDGDTPNDIRRSIRENGRLVLTNPDMLHQAILPHHEKWRRLFRTLRYIVIDEAHMYRGVFGSHVANVLRRLMRICRHYGTEPQLIFTTATIANPVEHAQALGGRRPKAVTESGAPAGEKLLVFYNPPLRDDENMIRQSPESAARRMMMDMLPQGAATITFSRSRKGVETLTRRVRESLIDRGRRAVADRVEGYRAGYLPEERRRIERGLRKGEIQAVVTTNALELGVDIGALDVCLLAGYPGTIASTWQQAGRAGRRQQAALIVLIAGADDVDQYLVRHPEYFLGAAPEHARIDPNNLLILAEHLKCAIFERPLGFEEGFGDLPMEDVQDIVAWMAEETRHFTQAGNAWHWASDNYPATAVNIRDAMEENFVIIDDDGPRPDVVGEVDFLAAHKTVYLKAIYLHGGRTYEVHRLDYEERKAYIRPVESDYYTTAVEQVRVFVLEEFEEAAPQEVQVGWGEVRVACRFVGYKKIRFRSGENIGYGEILLPDIEKHTTSFWLTFSADLIQRLNLQSVEMEAALSGTRNVLRIVSAVHAMCDPRDLGATIGSANGEAWVRQGDKELLSVLGGANDDTPEGHVDAQQTSAALDEGYDPTIFIYDEYPGGTGLAEQLFADAPTLLAAALRLVERCNCTTGCPSCVGPPTEYFDPDAKGSTLTLLRAAVDGMPVD